MDKVVLQAYDDLCNQMCLRVVALTKAVFTAVTFAHSEGIIDYDAYRNYEKFQLFSPAAVVPSDIVYYKVYARNNVASDLKVFVIPKFFFSMPRDILDNTLTVNLDPVFECDICQTKSSFSAYIKQGSFQAIQDIFLSLIVPIKMNDGAEKYMCSDCYYKHWSQTILAASKEAELL